MNKKTKEAIEKLVKKGCKKGYLYWDDIFALQTADEICELNEICEPITANNIKILERNYGIDEKNETTDYDYNSEDSFKTYLRDIGKYPLLTKEQEFELATLANKVVGGDKDAEDLLIKSNCRLVISIAKRFQGYIKGALSFGDFVQDGNMGLIKAARKFDCKKGFRFSTYATHWIKQAISRSIADSGKTIRLPVHVTESIKKLKKAEKELTNILGREPTVEELAAKLNITPEKATNLLQIMQDIQSLDSSVGDDETTTFGEMLTDTNAENPIDNAIDKDMQDAINKELSTLSPREQAVLRKRYGLDDDTPKTLEDVGKRYNVTRERVRQIEAKALRKLRSPSRSKTLKYYL